MGQESVGGEWLSLSLSQVQLLVQIDAQASLGGFTTVLGCRRVKVAAS